MPVLFIHGVAIRSEDEWPRIQKYPREYVAYGLNQQPTG